MLSLFKTSIIAENYSKKTVRCRQKLRKLKIQKQSEEDEIINNIRKLFLTKKENEAIKDKIVRDIKTLF